MLDETLVPTLYALMGAGALWLVWCQIEQWIERRSRERRWRGIRHSAKTLGRLHGRRSR